MHCGETGAWLCLRNGLPLLVERVARALRGHGQEMVVALLVIASCAGPTSTAPESTAEQGCEVSVELQQLAAEFRSLREVQGHFQGGPWIDEVDAWMGRKHQVMIELGEQLEGRGCRRGQITEHLGAPDLIVGPGDPLFEQVTEEAEFPGSPGEAYELLIYYWREARDFLYFAARGDIVTCSGWWHAYE